VALLTPLHAIQHAKQDFTVDTDRIYACGYAKRARATPAQAASILAQTYPDIVNGGFFCGGMIYHTPATGSKKTSSNGTWPDAPPALVDLDHRSSRFVLLAASKDSALHKIQGVRDAMIRDGFQHVSYLETPDDPNEGPPAAEWFNKGIVALDAVLAAAAPQKYKDAQSAEKKNLMGDALSLYRLAAAHGENQAFVPNAQAKADQLNQRYNDNLKEIQSLIADKKFPQASDAVHKLETLWGKLAVDKGSELLKQIAKAQSAMPE
jgi:hypothetical protein